MTKESRSTRARARVGDTDGRRRARGLATAALLMLAVLALIVAVILGVKLLSGADAADAAVPSSVALPERGRGPIVKEASPRSPSRPKRA